MPSGVLGEKNINSLVKDGIYGKLNKSVVRVDYKGLSTDTSTTTTELGSNYEDNTIKVDVKKVPNSLDLTFEGKTYTYDGSKNIQLPLSNVMFVELEEGE